MDKENRQKMLVELLLSNRDKWWSQKEIASFIKDYQLKESSATNDLCPVMFNDKIDINANLNICYIVVVKNYMFKIATKKEAKREIASHIRRLKAQRGQIVNIAKKIEMDGQVIMDLEVQDAKLDEFLKEFDCFETQE